MGYEPPLNRIETFIRRFLILPSESDYAVFTLWIAHTYFMHKLKTTPRLALISPEFGCGKSRSLEVLQTLCFQGLKLDHQTRSYLMRKVEDITANHGMPPTLLIDEIDSVFRSKNDECSEALRAFANTGYRIGGVYGVTEGERKKTPTEFKTFAPMALAGKGEILPESLMTRAIITRLQKRTGAEEVEDFLEDDLVALQADSFREELQNWADYCAEDIADIRPEMTVKDREREVWLPLFKIAYLAGEEWIKKVEVALANYQKEKSEDSPPRERELLGDVWKIFQKADKERIKSSHVVIALTGLEDSEWNSYNYGKPISEKALAKKLRTYGIRPIQMRFEDGQNARGYERSEVAVAVRRYLDPLLPATTATTETLPTLTLDSVAHVAHVAHTGVHD
jgi:hypothetical protein